MVPFNSFFFKRKQLKSNSRMIGLYSPAMRSLECIASFGHFSVSTFFVCLPFSPTRYYLKQIWEFISFSQMDVVSFLLKSWWLQMIVTARFICGLFSLLIASSQFHFLLACCESKPDYFLWMKLHFIVYSIGQPIVYLGILFFVSSTSLYVQVFLLTMKFKIRLTKQDLDNLLFQSLCWGGGEGEGGRVGISVCPDNSFLNSY